MKSTKSDKPCEPTVTYPCLMIGKRGAVVLFSDVTTGMVIYKGNSSNCIGEYINYWPANNFIPYNGSVCLEN